MKYYINLVILAVFLIGCSAGDKSTEALNQPTENEKIAIAKLEKIHSDIEIGLNIGEYKEKVSDAKFALEQVNSDSKIANSLDKAIEGHIIALD
ncbi:MAG: hypothetical protein AAGE84_05840 [Cyanobacteria bacterium P01_G01_bin.39]